MPGHSSNPEFSDNTSLVGESLSSASLRAIQLRSQINQYVKRMMDFNSAYDAGERNFSSLQWPGAELSELNLSGSFFIQANLERANMISSVLTGADLRGADLRGTNLRGADLRGANLTGADLTGANLTGAKLSNANLERTNFSGAILTDVDLRGAFLIDTIINYGQGIKGVKLFEGQIHELRNLLIINGATILPEILVIDPHAETERFTTKQL